jgi:hypothetical protein
MMTPTRPAANPAELVQRFAHPLELHQARRAALRETARELETRERAQADELKKAQKKEAPARLRGEKESTQVRAVKAALLDTTDLRAAIPGEDARLEAEGDRATVEARRACLPDFLSGSRGAIERAIASTTVAAQDLASLDQWETAGVAIFGPGQGKFVNPVSPRVRLTLEEITRNLAATLAPPIVAAAKALVTIRILPADPDFVPPKHLLKRIPELGRLGLGRFVAGELTVAPAPLVELILALGWGERFVPPSEEPPDADIEGPAAVQAWRERNWIDAAAWRRAHGVQLHNETEAVEVTT